jgi:dienelactone hydrolase
MKSRTLILIGAISLLGMLAIPARLTAQATISVKGTFQNGATLSGNYVVDVTNSTVVSADLFVGSVEFNVAPRIALAAEGFGGIDVSARAPAVGDVFLFGPTACSTLQACAVSATIPGPICSVSAPCGGAHSSVNLTTTGIVPLSNGTASSTTPGATLSASTLTFATQLVGTSSAAQSVTLTNYGGATLVISSVRFSGSDPGDFAQTQTCGSSVGPGASCTISITFKPAQPGSRTATLSITDNSPGSPQNVSLTGTGTVVELNPATLSFGTVQVGQSKNLSTTLTNTGSTTLNFSGITTTGSDRDEFSQTNTCGSSLGAGKSCTITANFRPTEAGSDSAQVSISDNSGGPQQVALSGAGCVYNPQKHKCVPTLNSPTVRSAVAAQSMAAVPRPTGPSKVGTRVVDLVDSTRDDPFLAEGIKRELLVRFWYPTPAGEDCKPADYTSRAVWVRFSQLLAMPLPDVKTNSCLDAPMTDGLHPVVVFTHGYTGTFTDYTFLHEDLASRGYVVASVDHTYEATAVEFPDGRFVKSLLGSHLSDDWKTDDETVSSALGARLDDLQFVLNKLERLNASSDTPFGGKLDLSKVAVAGHSLGGLTTWEAIHQDTRFKVGILLDPYLTNASPSSTETAVLMLLTGSEQRSEEECRLWSELLGPRLSVNLRGAEHRAPSDAVWLAKGTISTGAMGPEKTVEAVRDYIAAFLDTNLRGAASNYLLTGPSRDYPDAAVTTQRQLLCDEPQSH